MECSMNTSFKILALMLVAGGAAGAASAQTGVTGATTSTTPARPAREVVSAVRPEVATLTKMNRRVTLKVEDTRLEDVIKFVQDVTQADIEPIWNSDGAIGLDKEKKITVNIKNQPGLYAVEMILEKARTDSYELTWQMSDTGTMQIGPKEALNKYKRIAMYNIDDLLFVIPRYAQVPQIDLNNVLQSNGGGGGGGGQSPFTNTNDNNNNDAGPDKEARAKKIIDLLVSLVEPSQWQDNGGDGATQHFYNGTLIVNAADYIHRQINGYPYWVSGVRQVARKAGEHRWVTLNMDTGISKIDKIRNTPVTAVVPGNGGGGTPGGGGGGGTPGTPPPPNGPP
jgi:hypothetical protein